MIAKTGLLVVTNPKHISKILPTVKKQVKNTLYIHLTSALKPLGRLRPEIFSSIPKYSQTIRVIYSEAVRHCKDLDVRLLLSSLKYSSVNSINTLRQVEVVIFDKLHEKTDIDSFLTSFVNNIKRECSIITLEDGENAANEESGKSDDPGKPYKHVVLGGTFDRLHVGHKMLLTEAILRATEKVTVGVTDINMLNGKILCELVESCNDRIDAVKKFVNEICPELHYEIVPIEDPFGPTKTGKDMEMIVVSAETIKGGMKVNDIRKENGLQALDIFTVELVDCPDRQKDEEEKISSSTNRMRLLGTLLKKVESKIDKNGPYIIGLTGGIASGKSYISKKLFHLGAAHIDCDKVAHELYKAGMPCHSTIVKTFGSTVLGEDGEINRKALGAIVFRSKDEMLKLNSMVWPLIASEVKERISQLYKSGHKVIIVEAAILHQAGWHRMCHEVWACIIPPDEAVRRLKDRNGLSEEDAKARLAMQISNNDHVKNANVVLCSLWSYEYTQQIVERAWALLNERLQTLDENV